MTLTRNSSSQMTSYACTSQHHCHILTIFIFAEFMRSCLAYFEWRAVYILKVIGVTGRRQMREPHEHRQTM
jgi:hypothetical protein